MKLSKRILLFVICAALAILSCGCGGAAVPEAPTASVSAPSSVAETAPSPSEAAEPPSTPPESEAGHALTVTDQAGRTVEIPGPVETVVSCYYISSSACIALGLTDKMVGVEAKAASRPIYALAAPVLLELPNVGTAKEFNLEGCLALEPDLVILPMQLKDAAETLTDMGVPAILVNPESYENLRGMIALIGEASGEKEAADKLLGYFESARADVSNRTAPLSVLPTVYMGGVSSYLETAPKDMYQSSLIALAGGRNAAEEIEGSGWAEVSYEQLLAMNPDYIILPSEASYGIEDVTGDAQLAGLLAVQNGRVFKMPGAFEAWDSPVPSCMLGARWLLGTLHEDVYSKDSLREDTANFYREFYGVEVDTAPLSNG